MKTVKQWITRLVLVLGIYSGFFQPHLQSQTLSLPSALPNPISIPLLAQSAMPSGSDAEAKFTNLYLNLKRFAGVLLLIGLVVGAIMWFMGKTSVAIGVISGGLILYGGAYILALLRDSL